MTIEQEITTLIRSFRKLTGVGVCFYDTEKFFRYNSSGEKEYRGHYCEFCRNVRLLPGGKTACEKSDRVETINLALSYKKPFFFCCHMGLRELVVPVLRNERLLGVIFLGQCRIKGEDLSTEIAEGAKALSGDIQQFLELYNDLPEMKSDDLLVMGDLFNLFFSRISDEVTLFQNEGIPVDSTKRSVSRQIANYIEMNFHREITPILISKRFFVNISHMDRLFRSEMGMTVTDYILKVRLENACRLLNSSNLPISSISLNVGYTDAGYFTRLFRKSYGITPTEYRKNNLN